MPWYNRRQNGNPPPKKRKNIKKVPTFSFNSLLLSSVKTQGLWPTFWHFYFSRWPLLGDNHFDWNHSHVGLLPVPLIRLDSGEEGLFCSILYSQNSEFYMTHSRRLINVYWEKVWRCVALSQQWPFVRAWPLRADPASNKDGSLRKTLWLYPDTCFMNTPEGKHSNKNF